jgi:hypothetical protein
MLPRGIRWESQAGRASGRGAVRLCNLGPAKEFGGEMKGHTEAWPRGWDYLILSNIRYSPTSVAISANIVNMVAPPHSPQAPLLFTGDVPSIRQTTCQAPPALFVPRSQRG